ncbi:MAG: nitrate reductase molybdenum cofactor assembly chaperone [Myxococcota bacterium]
MQQASQELLETLGQLLSYPRADYAARADAALAYAPATAAACREHLEHFRAYVRATSAAELEETYARTFDLSPVCVPYLSVHVFGEESFKRAQLMTGLADAYTRASLPSIEELPDHLSVVLRRAGAFTPEEWQELVQYCLREPLGKMCAALTRAESPYAHVLGAVLALLQAPGGGGETNA